MDLPQPVEAEIFDGEAGGQGAVGQGLFERFGLEVALLGQVAHHAAGKTVAGAGGIDHLRRRIGRQHVGFVLAEEHGPVLALLDDDEAAGPSRARRGRPGPDCRRRSAASPRCR